MALLVKNLPAMRETWIRSLGWEDPLEKSYPLSKPFWLREFHGLYKSMGLQRLPTPLFWPREFHGLYSPWGRKELDTTKRLSLSLQCYRKSVRSPAAHHLRGNKQARLVERKVCFISDACNCGGRVVDIHPKAGSPYPCNQWDKSFYRHK